MTSQPGGSAADLLVGRRFVVTSVAGSAAIHSPTAELGFGDDGRLTGRATVNRVFGPYRCEGSELLCGPLATTLMAGPPEAMVQEQELLALLGAALVVRPTEDGVDLLAADGRSIGLRAAEGADAVL